MTQNYVGKVQLFYLPTHTYALRMCVVPTGFLIWPILIVFFVCRFGRIFLLPKLEWNLLSWEENSLEMLWFFFVAKCDLLQNQAVRNKYTMYCILSTTQYNLFSCSVSVCSIVLVPYWFLRVYLSLPLSGDQCRW